MPRLLLVLAVTLAGCRAPARPPGAGSADTEENQATLRKLQGYIDCLSEHSSRVFQIADTYSERLAGKPPTTETAVLVHASGDPTRCVEAIGAAKTLRPSLPELEATADAFARAVQRVFTITTAAHDYFDPSNKKYYDRAKGIALHPKLVAAFHDFDVAQGTLFDQVYRLNHKVHLDQVARREQRDGRTLEIRRDIMMLRAEELVRFAATPWDHLDKLDMVAFTAALHAFEDAIEDLTAFALTHPKDTERIAKFWSLLEEAKAYLVAGKQLAHRVREDITYTEAEKIMIGANNEASIIGSPAALARAYNRLVQSPSPR